MMKELEMVMGEVLEQLHLLDTQELEDFRTHTFEDLFSRDYPQYIFDCYIMLFDSVAASADRR